MDTSIYICTYIQTSIGIDIHTSAMQIDRWMYRWIHRYIDRQMDIYVCIYTYLYGVDLAVP